MPLLLAFVAALGMTAVLIPLLAWLAPAVGLTDRPGGRKVHSVAVPRVGGIAMVIAILVSALLVLEPTAPVRGLLAGVLVLVVVGVWDDLADLSYRIKFLGQIVAVTLCIALGDIRIQTFSIGTDIFVFTPLLSWSITFLFLIGVTNAVNLSDGLDGLAGGIAVLCFCALALLAAASHNYTVMALALIEAGAILGFLRFNTHPARVFMGDGGSQVLGFTIGALAILATQSDTSVVSAALPLLLVGMPIVDTLAVMLYRMRHGLSPFAADRNHIHHRLLNLGFTHGEAVIILYLVQVVLFLLAYFLRFQSDVVVVLVFVGFSAALLLTLRRAQIAGWRAHPAAITDRASRTPRARWAPPAAAWLMWGCLFAYAAMVVYENGGLGTQAALIAGGLLVLLAVWAIVRRSGAAGWVERAGAYIAVVVLVYLDARAHPQLWLDESLWGVLVILAIAALASFYLTPKDRFQITSLDVLVVFIALVIPHLPSGTLALPSGIQAGVTKSLILLYAVEMLMETRPSAGDTDLAAADQATQLRH